METTINQAYQDIIALLRQSKAETQQRYKADVIGLFGSYARGEQTNESDVDILVKFAPGASLFDLVRLGNYLEKRLQKKVDIVSERALRHEIQSYVYQDLIRV